MALFSWFHQSNNNQSMQTPAIKPTVNHSMWPTAKVSDSLKTSDKTAHQPKQNLNNLAKPSKVNLEIVG